MKPVDVSDKDWEEALFTGIPANKKDDDLPKEFVHVFLQRNQRPRYIFLLENGCLVRGNYLRKNSDNRQQYINRHKDRYLGIGIFHNIQD